MNWINRFAELGPGYSTKVLPSPVPQAFWVSRNFELSEALGLPPAWLMGDEGLAVFSGNGVWEGMASDGSAARGQFLGVRPEGTCGP